MSLCFFLLGFAGLEFSIGMLLVIIFKHLLKVDYFFEKNIVQNNSTSTLGQGKTSFAK